jgi:hypothetical protein
VEREGDRVVEVREREREGGRSGRERWPRREERGAAGSGE